MTHSCRDCGRPNAAHRHACIYCGGALPEPTEQPPDQASLPADIDHLVRQAMTMGTTANLAKALAEHKDTVVEDLADSGDPLDDTPPVAALLEAAKAAAEAEQKDDRGSLIVALDAASAALGRCAPLRTPEPAPERPTILLPKVRRTYALVMDGMGDVDRHPELVSALGIDGVTARMLAIARQPRVVLRSDDASRLREMAETLTKTIHIAAAVVDPDTLRSHGPAQLLVSFTGGARSTHVANWQADLQGRASSEQGELISEAPVLVVPGEVVVLKYRSVRSGGRLKHLREGRMDAGAELRLAVADLHMPSGIYRVLEGVTDLSDAPAAIADSFRRSLLALTEQWSETGCRVLEPRTCAPAMDNAPVYTEDQMNMTQNGWPEWEEHSRCARILFMNDESATGAP